MNNIFRFQQFAIRQDRSVWKIGTDSVLLGAWAQLPKGPVDALDIGMGAGVLSLMIAQRYPEARITGIEIDAETAAEAGENVKHSPWSDRITVVNRDVFAFAEEDPGKFDVVISNPPYFTGGIPSTDTGKRRARHGEGLNAHSLPALARRLMHPEGSLCLVIPWNVASTCIAHANTDGLYVSRRLNILHKWDSVAPSLCLLELTTRVVKPEVESLAIHEQGGYSEAFWELTEGYLLLPNPRN